MLRLLCLPKTIIAIMVGISGSAEKDMSMTYSDDDINIDGVKGDCTVEVYSDTVNFDTVDF